MKIVYVTTDSFMDHGYTIVKYLKQAVDINVFILAKEKSEEINDICNKLNAPFLKRPRYRDPFSFLFELKFLYNLRKLKADVVWFDSFSLLRSLFVKIFLKNFLISIHDFDFHPNLKDIQAKLSQSLTYGIHKNHICMVSHTQEDIFFKKYGIKPMVFQLPIIDYYLDSGNSGHTVLEKNDKEINKIRFFFFSSIERYKGIEILLEAAEYLEKKNIEFELNIYGKLKYNEKEISDKVNSLKNVKINNSFINYKNVHKLYSENDLLILPYRQVTQCGPLLIGYADGMPCICNDLPGFREYVDDEKSGLFFDGTSENLADKMEYIINNRSKIKEMSDYIRCETYKKFSMEFLKEDYKENFKLLIQ